MKTTIIFLLLLSMFLCRLAFCGEIHDAAKSGDLEKVKMLVKSQPDLVFSKDENGATPLHAAAFGGHKDVAQLLVANKADVNAVNNYGMTPLHVSAIFNHKDVAEILLANKADINARDSDGDTASKLALSAGFTDLAELLRHQGGLDDQSVIQARLAPLTARADELTAAPPKAQAGTTQPTDKLSTPQLIAKISPDQNNTSQATNVSSQGQTLTVNSPIIINAHSLGPTEPVWLDNRTVAYKVYEGIQVSMTEYVPSGPDHANFDFTVGKETLGNGFKDQEYGILSHDKKCLLDTWESGDLVIGHGMQNVMSHIKLTERVTNFTNAEFSCAEEVQGVSLSPDDQIIVFAKAGTLWRIRVGESTAQVLFESNGNDRFPAYSNDGQQIYFIKDTINGSDFFALDMVSKTARQLSRGLNPNNNFSISPCGDFILFSSTNGIIAPSGLAGNIWQFNIQSGKAEQLTVGATDQYPAFSPNCQAMAFSRQQGFYETSKMNAFNVVVMQCTNQR